MVQHLQDMGHAACSPGDLPDNEVVSRPRVGISSCWSQRHAAFVAGLGTFGISGGLITRRGVAHRLRSVVTDAEITSTSRPYGDDPFAWCLRTARGACGACIKRCLAGSIGESPEHRDKVLCRNHAAETINPWASKNFEWQGTYGCGLCQTAVPCEDRNPTGPA